MKKALSGRLLTLILTLAACWAVSPFVAYSLALLQITGVGALGRILLAYGFLIVLFVLSVILHEGGHWLAGKLSGYRLVSFRVGPFMFIPKENGTEVKKLRLSGTAGQCLMSPPEMKDGRFPVTFYNLGGPLANLLAAFLSFVILLLTGFIFPNAFVARPYYPYLSLFLSGSMLVNLILALTNGIPMSVGGVSNDGRNALYLRKDPEALRAFWIQLRTNEALVRGARLSQLPEDWFELPSNEKMNNGICASLAYLRECLLMDRHEYPAALELSGRLLSTKNAVSQLQKNMLECDRITASLLLGDHSFAFRMEDRALSRFLAAMKDSPGVLSTRYVHALLHKGDTAEAEGIRKKFEERKASYPYECDIENAEELMDAADRAFRAGKEEAFTP